MQGAEEIQYNKERNLYPPAARAWLGTTYLRISCSASSCTERTCVSATNIKLGSRCEGGRTDHVGDAVLDPVNVLALRADHLAVGDDNLHTGSESRGS